jgi:hypothetical protein
MSDGYEFAVAFVRSRYGTTTPPDWRTRCQTVAARLRTITRNMDGDTNAVALLRHDELLDMVAVLEGAK